MRPSVVACTRSPVHRYRAGHGRADQLRAAPRARRHLGLSTYDRAHLDRGGDDPVHEIEVINALDSAAVKLGGDPAKHTYGAPEH